MSQYNIIIKLPKPDYHKFYIMITAFEITNSKGHDLITHFNEALNYERTIKYI